MAIIGNIPYFQTNPYSCRECWSGHCLDMGTCEFFGLNFGAAKCGKNASGSNQLGLPIRWCLHLCMFCEWFAHDFRYAEAFPNFCAQFVPFGILRFQCLSLQGSLFATNFVMPRPGGFLFSQHWSAIAPCGLTRTHTHTRTVATVPPSLLVTYGSWHIC